MMTKQTDKSPLSAASAINGSLSYTAELWKRETPLTIKEKQ
jgi:hypothetical protein